MKPIVYIETSTQLQKCDSWQNGRNTIVYWRLSERMSCVCSRPLKSYILFSEKWRSKRSKRLHKLTDRWQHSWRHYILIVTIKSCLFTFSKVFLIPLDYLILLKISGPHGNAWRLGSSRSSRQSRPPGKCHSSRNSSLIDLTVSHVTFEQPTKIAFH